MFVYKIYKDATVIHECEVFTYEDKTRKRRCMFLQHGINERAVVRVHASTHAMNFLLPSSLR